MLCYILYVTESFKNYWPFSLKLNGAVLHVHHLINTGMMKEPVRALVTHAIIYKNKSTFLGHVFCVISTHWSSSCQLIALRFPHLKPNALS